MPLNLVIHIDALDRSSLLKALNEIQKDIDNGLRRVHESHRIVDEDWEYQFNIDEVKEDTN